MFKWKIKYENFDGREITETAYFHISKGEMIRFVSSGLIDPYELEFIMKAKDYNQIYLTFEKFVRLSYGRRTDDGNRFIKDDEVTKAFMSSPAFDSFFEDILSSGEKASAFAGNLFPPNLVKEATDAIARKKETVLNTMIPEKPLALQNQIPNDDFEAAVAREVAKRLANAEIKTYS